MLTVGDIMTADPITISPYATLREAVELLSTHGISGTPVLDGQTLVGTLSAGDIIDFEAGTGSVPTERELGGLDESIAPSADDGDADFYIDWWDDAGADVVERIRCADRPEWDYLSQHRVHDAMSRELTTFRRGESVDDAAAYMRETGTHSAIVADDGILVGIITTMDITRAVADHRTNQSPTPRFPEPS